jgi:hypothetical protein
MIEVEPVPMNRDWFQRYLELADIAMLWRISRQVIEPRRRPRNNPDRTTSGFSI